MKKHITLVFAIVGWLCSSYSAFGQQVDVSNFYRYYALVDSADSLAGQGAFKEAAGRYADAFSIKDKGAEVYEHHINAAIYWASAGVTERSFDELFFVANTHAYSLVEDALEDSAFMSLKSDNRRTDLLAILNKRKEEAESKISVSAVNLLAEVRDRDQAVRNSYLQALKELGAESPKMKEYERDVLTADSLNYQIVDSLLAPPQGLSPFQLGEEGMKTVYLVLVHNPLEKQKKYLPYLRESYEYGLTSGFDLAQLEDRIRTREKSGMLYGSNYVQDDNGNWGVRLQGDVPTTDMRRAALGLDPLSSSLKRNEAVIIDGPYP